MSQVLSQIIGQHMRMEQRLTPQLIQSMAILQLPVADLEALIQQEIEKNGALEVVEPTAAPTDGKPPAQNGKEDGSAEGSDSFSRLDRLTREYELDFDDARATFRRAAPAWGERDAKMDAMANTACRGITLHEYLVEQWALQDSSPPIADAGELIINHLDADGYLRVRLDEIAAKHDPPPSLEVMEEALRAVQKLDPPGIGARDLRECLLLQIDALPGDNSIERRIVEDHLDDIARNRLPAIAKATGYQIGEISEALNAMRQTLVMHPGYLVGERQELPIRPDVIVEYAETGGGLDVRLARGNGPRLRISPKYLEMAKSRGNGKDVRTFARSSIESAHALIDAVTFRRNRLLDVARIIVDKQQEFFELGAEGLKVLRMSDVANQLDCDPSTISRTVADKYMQTPRGIFPLRYFFTGGTETDSGETKSWDSVKSKVAQIIKEENPKEPLNDDQIVRVLKKQGIEISRRTVAKYRQQLDIPSSRRRRKF